MGIPAQSSLSRRRAQAGLALPAAMLGLIAISVLVAGIWTVVDLNRRDAENRVSAIHALQLAEAGASHALSLLRGPMAANSLGRVLLGFDSAAATLDDGLLIGYGLDDSTAIPSHGRTYGNGSYFVTFVDDPAETDGDPLRDSNNRVVARCRGVVHNGASATIAVVIGAVTLPAVAAEGNIRMNGNPSILGPCGGVHANQITDVSGNPTVQGTVSASDTVTVSGSIRRPDGSTNTPLSHQPPVEIPTLDPNAYCLQADYELRADGFLVIVATGATHDARSNEVFGWKRSSGPPEVMWTLSGNTAPPPGTYCVRGNATVSGNPGGPGTPAELTLVATGSIDMSGNPNITSDQTNNPDDILLLAGGDVQFSGNASGSSNNYNGVIYSGSQCKINGNPRLFGQLLCKDQPEPPGAKDIVSTSDINASLSGNPTITYNCGGRLAGRRRVLNWYQLFGT